MIRERHRGNGKYIGVLAGCDECAPAVVNARPTIALDISTPTIQVEVHAAVSGSTERLRKTRVTRYRSFQQAERCEYSFFGERVERRQGTQIKIVGSRIAGWSLCCAPNLGCLQSRLNNASDADCHAILKLE